MKRSISIREMTLCALFTVLTAVGAFIRIPIPVVPFTLQFFFTTMAGLLLGGRAGALSVTLYALLGLAGLPIFAEGGGLWYVLKPGFGYIIGFIAGSYTTGKMTERPRPPKDAHGFAREFAASRRKSGAGNAFISISLGFRRILAANFAGLAIVYGTGMTYYYIVSNFVVDAPIGLWPLFLYCFLLAAPGDIFLCFLAAATARRLKPAIARMYTERHK